MPATAREQEAGRPPISDSLGLRVDACTVAPLVRERASQQAVSPVGVLNEVGGVPAGVPHAVFWKEDAVRALRPTWARLPQVCRPEALRKAAISPGAAYVFDEATHGPSVTLGKVSGQPQVGLFVPNYRQPQDQALAALVGTCAGVR
jgi:hypothetical protein